MILHDYLLEEGSDYLEFDGMNEAQRNALKLTQLTLPLAQKFHLTEDFIKAGSESPPEDRIKTKHLFKLPYPETWLEWSSQVDTKHNGKAYSVRGRLGALLQESPDHPGQVLVISFGLMQLPDRWNTWGLGICHAVFDPESVEMTPAGVGFAMRMDSLYRDRAEHFNTMRTALYDVHDYITRINSPAITVIGEDVDVTKINKKRLRNDKPMVLSYRVVDLEPGIKRILQETGEGEHDGRRLHWRRGHFKARKTGVFWWNAHMAGKQELGEVEKHYNVEA